MDSTVDQIKARLSIVDVVGGYVQLQKAGRNYRARCPFHKERTPSFMLSPERGTYMCFGCGEKGDIFSFVEKMDGIDFKTALVQLADRAGVEIVRTHAAPEHKEHDERLREVCEEATRFFEEALRARADILEYLHGRGLKDETITSWRIGYAPASWEDLSGYLFKKGFSKDDIYDAGLAARSERKQGEIYDRFRGRIMFPLFDVVGRPIAFSGRFFEKVEGSREEGDPAKYVNSPETDLFKKSKVLYGFDRAKDAIRKMDCILLVEGQFDVVLSHQSGLPFAVAISGTALTQEHLSLLSRMSKRLVLALDADEAGVRSGLKSAAMALACGFDVKIPKIEGGKDPAELAQKDPELLRAAVRGSVPAVEFFLDALRSGAKDERGYKKIVENQVLQLIAAIPSKIDQAHFVQVVAERLRVPEDAVRSEVARKPKQFTEMEEVSETAAAAKEDMKVAALPLERRAGMLLFHFGKDSDTGKRLLELLGKERLENIEEKMRTDAERLRFEFESLGDDLAAITGELLMTIERSLLDEEIAAARESLALAEAGHNAAEAAEITLRIVHLTRRKHELNG